MRLKTILATLLISSTMVTANIKEAAVSDPYVVVNLFSEISANTTKVVKHGIDLAKKTNKKLLLVINSPGGSVDEESTILHMMNNSGVVVDTYDIGMAASAASIIFASGKHRYIAPMGVVLTHYAGMGGSGGKAIDFENGAQMLRATDEGEEIILSMITGMTIEEVKDKLLRPALDLTHNSQKSVEYGLADEITSTVVDSGDASFEDVPMASLIPQ